MCPSSKEPSWQLFTTINKLQIIIHYGLKVDNGGWTYPSWMKSGQWWIKFIHYGDYNDFNIGDVCGDVEDVICDNCTIFLIVL